MSETVRAWLDQIVRGLSLLFYQNDPETELLAIDALEEVRRLTVEAMT